MLAIIIIVRKCIAVFHKFPTLNSLFGCRGVVPTADCRRDRLVWCLLSAESRVASSQYREASLGTYFKLFARTASDLVLQ